MNKTFFFLPVTLWLTLLLNLGSIGGAWLSQPPTAVQAANIIYVNHLAPAGGNGQSWATAHHSLTNALTAAQTGDEIWVATGVYKPTWSGQFNRNLSFHLKAGVQLFGGFAGHETSRDERDWQANPTVLSGDTDHNDHDPDGDGIIAHPSDMVGNNIYHVVRATGTAEAPITSATVLDGFIITGGAANGNLFPDNAGGGFYCDGMNGACSPNVRNVILRGNTAVFGGGMYNNGYGGFSNPTLYNVQFLANTATSRGGGLLNNGEEGMSSPLMMEVRFEGNSAVEGGALYNDGSFGGVSSPNLRHAVFANNHATLGGAIYNFGQQGTNSPVFTNVSVVGNVATQLGGGFYHGANSTATIQNSLIWHNLDATGVPSSSASSYRSATAQPMFRYSLVRGCQAGGSWQTSCGTNGGNNRTDADPRLASLPDLDRVPYVGSDLRLGVGSAAINVGYNLYNPAPADMAGNQRLVGGTIDLGAYEAVEPSCPASGVRYVNSKTTGIGDGLSWATAYRNVQDALVIEYGEPCEIWVASGVYQPTADPTDREATFWIRPGLALYGGFAGTETSRDQRDWATQPTVLSGDIDGNDLAVNEWGMTTHAANIVGGNSLHVVTLAAVEERPADFQPPLLDGFVVTAGQANIMSQPPQVQAIGGGVYCMAKAEICQPVLRHLHLVGNYAIWGAGMYLGSREGGLLATTLSDILFENNTAHYSGGGLYHEVYGTGSQSELHLQEVRFVQNTAAQSLGGGLYLYAYESPPITPTLTYVEFRGNQARQGGGFYSEADGIAQLNPILTYVSFIENKADEGGGMYNFAGDEPSRNAPRLTHVSFESNYAQRDGGAIYNEGDSGISNPILHHVQFEGNHAERDGGAIYNEGSEAGDASPSLTEVTFVGNVAGQHGGAMYNHNGEGGMNTPHLTHVTFRNNVAGQNGGGMYNNGQQGASSPHLTHVSLVGNSAGGAGGGLYNAGYGVLSSQGEWLAGQSNPVLINVLLMGNHAGAMGGGMFNDGRFSLGQSNPTLTNVTVVGNHAPTGGGLYNAGHDGGQSVPLIQNSLFWHNEATETSEVGRGTAALYSYDAQPTVRYSLVEGCYPNGVWLVECGTNGGQNTADADPLLVLPPTLPSKDGSQGFPIVGDARLQAGSPAIDTGDNGVVTVTTDLAGGVRVYGSAVDLGAYETQPTLHRLYLPLVVRNP